jgi:hypothetical protein
MCLSMSALNLQRLCDRYLSRYSMTSWVDIEEATIQRLSGARMNTNSIPVMPSIVVIA